MENNCCLFEGFKKIQQNDVFLFGTFGFVLEILTFLYYADWESDDVVNCATNIVKYSIRIILEILEW